MPSLRIGQTNIPYTLRRTATASERRITVTPAGVEVLALSTDDDEVIDRFLNRKREWVYQAVRELDELASERTVVPRFITGSKIPYRGRMASLTVLRTDASRIEIGYQNGFSIRLPAWVSETNADALVANELKLWLKRRVRRDVHEIVATYRKKFELTPCSIRVGDMSAGWGSCSSRGGLSINWLLVLAPKAVLRYVVVHELAHLKLRSHGLEFWRYLASLLSDYERAKGWLDRHQHKLDDGFLQVRSAPALLRAAP
ncbi:M48 family metallopeptidase [Methylobacterium soli]|uniref:M48 family metallopeptidase n=1 Tax=Methylobacterium soli TaxID=553447 RepID=A0A6L3SUW1_9HYPH|nr:SprT family zinc-dependent metalloprotease [Methylobacterium soli]KAB1077441.1 M48 family metallopeptidase [Methylobacterium soli]GJE45888.1 hypothetical protein AEGHOMDF_5088 [Methylobacterium soli]